MKTEQRDSLRALLDHARRATTYYADRLPALSEPLPENTVDWFSQLPLLSREDLQRNGVRLRSQVGDPATWRLVRTTGTSGEPAEVVLDGAARAAEAATLAEHIDRCLGTRNWREHDTLHLALHPEAVSRAMPSPWQAGARVIKWNLCRSWQSEDRSFLQSLGHIDGCIVTALPSVAELLAGRLLCARLLHASATRSVRPLLLLLSGETVEPEARSLIGEAFGCPVSSLYTLAEAGIVGTECPTDGGYHVEEAGAVVEVLDECGRGAPPNCEGEVVVTPLANRAMPLIRYRTGDRGRWLPTPCRCERPGPRLALITGRRPVRLVAASGATVNILRFAKLLTALPVERFAFDQAETGTVVISYQAGRALESTSRDLVEGAVRAALGPETEVCWAHVSVPVVTVPAVSAASPVREASTSALSEPDGLDIAAIRRWLQRALAGEPDLEAAVLTGSALDPEFTTRFSDIDLVLLARQDRTDPSWLKLARDLRRRVPQLSVTVDLREGLERRAPLLACRLLREQLPVIGRLDVDVLPWPSHEVLRCQARFWAQETEAALWLRLTSIEARAVDPVREAWVAAKDGLTALRFHYLLRGERETAARAVLGLARHFAKTTDWLADLLNAIEVAREHSPPPLAETEAARRYLSAALSCVRCTAASL